jgi:hypothetical protein
MSRQAWSLFRGAPWWRGTPLQPPNTAAIKSCPTADEARAHQLPLTHLRDFNCLGVCLSPPWAVIMIKEVEPLDPIKFIVEWLHVATIFMKLTTTTLSSWKLVDKTREHLLRWLWSIDNREIDVTAMQENAADVEILLTESLATTNGVSPLCSCHRTHNAMTHRDRCPFQYQRHLWPEHPGGTCANEDHVIKTENELMGTHINLWQKGQDEKTNKLTKQTLTPSKCSGLEHPPWTLRWKTWCLRQHPSSSILTELEKVNKNSSANLPSSKCNM